MDPLLIIKELKKELAEKDAKIENLKLNNYLLTECGKQSVRLLNRLPAAYCLSTVEGFGAELHLVRGLYNEGLRRLLGYSAVEFEAMKAHFYKLVIHEDDYHLNGDALQWFEEHPASQPFLTGCRLMTSDQETVYSIIINSELSKYSDGRSREMLSVGIPLNVMLHKPEIIEDWLKESRRSQNRSVISLLTERMREVLALFVKGYSNAQVAKILFLSKRTIEKHRDNIYRIMNVHNRIQLNQAAKSMGLD
jgi:DNA-binding CsgD family transcriptional regulator